MRYFQDRRWYAAFVVLGMAAASTGCGNPRAGFFYRQPPPPAPLGTLSDPVWQTQEVNAEASKFVVYEHEFVLGGVRMNMAGQNHVKQIAARLDAGAPFPVAVERSMTSTRPEDEYQFPVHPNPELDNRRREVVVRALTAMGIADADQRVVVAPAFAEGYTGPEAEAAYQRSLYNNSGQGGFGGFGGGFGGFGAGQGGIGGGF